MQKHIDEHLLLSYYTGSLSADQQREVEQWLQESEENRKLAHDIQYIYMATDTLNTIKEINSAKALEQVKRRFHKSNKTNLLVWFQRVAAILILPLLISTIYFVTKKEPVEYIEIKTNPGMVATLNLPDGSKVWLNSGSYLKHPQKFIGDTRSVELDGEAYFSVQKDAKRKFVVHTNQEQVRLEVLGTEFNVDAYYKNEFIATTLVSGSVRVAYLTDKNRTNTVLIKPEEKVVYNRNEKSVLLSKTDVQKDIAWKDGVIILRNTPLNDVLWTLSKRFNVEFEIRNKTIMNSSFTGVFKDQQLESILEHFKFASHVKYTIQEEIGINGEILKRKVILY